jgi:hypothetical protein
MDTAHQIRKPLSTAASTPLRSGKTAWATEPSRSPETKLRTSMVRPSWFTRQVPSIKSDVSQHVLLLIVGATFNGVIPYMRNSSSRLGHRRLLRRRPVVGQIPRRAPLYHHALLPDHAHRRRRLPPSGGRVLHSFFDCMAGVENGKREMPPLETTLRPAQRCL